MAITTNFNDPDLSVSLTYTALREKLEKGLEYAAKFIYYNFSGYGYYVDSGDGIGVLISFDELTNAQKLEILDKYVKATLLSYAKDEMRKEEINVVLASVNEDTSIEFN